VPDKPQASRSRAYLRCGKDATRSLRRSWSCLVEGLTVGWMGMVCPVGVWGGPAGGGGGSLADVASPVAVVKEAFPEGDV
jgi:hypothetical protein